MLPVYLRDSRHAASKKGTKRPRCDEIPPGDCGGPIQSAITTDLIHLRKRFREALIDYTKDHPVSLELWKPGTVFSVFKEVFRSSKIGMLHLLPPARCDREAYSQLIYGASLSLFKASFMKIQRENMAQMEDSNDGSIDHYNDTGFAMFLLLALFETNPLPREIGTENPLELLSIGLRSLEDPRASNRRCFSKNIRIDRQHFCLMLRLKELALARKSNGERLFFECQRPCLKESASRQNASESSTEFSGNCGYGMSTDIIEVLERIIPRLELCEYTGPVGAEAFAGHAEYPHNDSINRQESDSREATTTALENELYHIDSSGEKLNEITSLLQKYKSSVTAIRIPQSKSNRVKRLQSALQPLFSQTEHVQSDNSVVIDIDPTIQIERNPNDIEIEEDHIDTEYESGSFGHSNALSQCKLVVDRRINPELRGALHASVMALLTRDELLFPISDIASGIAKSSLDADDVSSIGHGGISIATRNKNLGSRNARSAKERSATKTVTKQSLANEFLTSKQTAEASSDEESVDSEITVSSFSGVEEDEISVATSAFGKRALKDLLQNVADEGIDVDGKKRIKKKRKTGPKNSKKRKNKTVDIEEDLPGEELDDGVMSTATSAFGKRALDDLLKDAARKDDTDGNNTGRSRINKQTSKPKSAKAQSKRKNAAKESSLKSKRKSANDEISVATSALGKRALDDLLEQADSDIDVPNNGDEETSVATSAFGKRALDDLLKVADSRTNNPASKGKTTKKATKKQKKGRASSKEPQSTPKGGDDEISVATSAFGKRALDDLLQNLGEDESKL